MIKSELLLLGSRPMAVRDRLGRDVERRRPSELCIIAIDNSGIAGGGGERTNESDDDDVGLLEDIAAEL